MTRIIDLSKECDAEIDPNVRTVVRRFKTTRTGLDWVVYIHR